MAFVLQWGTASLAIENRGALSDILEQIHNDRASSPVLVHLSSELGAVMSLGVGGTMSILHYVSPGGWPALTAMGIEPSAQGLLVFAVGDEETEMPACFGMPFEMAKEGLLIFLETGEMDERFDWQED